MSSSNIDASVEVGPKGVAVATTETFRVVPLLRYWPATSRRKSVGDPRGPSTSPQSPSMSYPPAVAGAGQAESKLREAPLRPAPVDVARYASKGAIVAPGAVPRLRSSKSGERFVMTKYFAVCSCDSFGG